MLVSRDRGHTDRARHLATQARDPAPHYQHSAVGFNYRLSNLLAAVGRGQLARIEDRVAARRRIRSSTRRRWGISPGSRSSTIPRG